MKIYITAPFKGGDNKREIEELCALVKRSGFEDFCFIRDVEQYQKMFHDAHELMTRAREEIERCDALLIDFDGPASGRMIELGIAYALRKKVVLITKKGTFVKETVRGVTDGVIEYEMLEDIVDPMKQLVEAWKHQRV
jgi:nucleoside 2-deoxyribosyltransferase